MTIRVALVDDHQLLRDALRLVIEGAGDMAVVGEAGDGRAALALLRKANPDVVLLDVAMPGLNDIETAVRIRVRHPGVKILALSAHADRRYVLEMLNAGAGGYMTKSAGGPELLRAIRTVAKGQTYLPAELAGVVVAGLRDAHDTRGSRSLGGREREVLQLIAEGRRSPEIAARLFISVATVDAHRRNIMRKLDLHTIAELTRFAIREGLTSL